MLKWSLVIEKINYMKITYIAFGVGIAVVVGGLLWLSAKATHPQNELVWPGTEIACLPNGHTGIAKHIHPSVSLFVQGQEIPIRANIGISDTCMAEIHTHDTTGQIHIETVDPNKTYTISDFFAVLGEEMDREGFALTATLNGENVDDIAFYPLEDGDAVVLSYDAVQEGEVVPQ